MTKHGASIADDASDVAAAPNQPQQRTPSVEPAVSAVERPARRWPGMSSFARRRRRLAAAAAVQTPAEGETIQRAAQRCQDEPPRPLPQPADTEPDPDQDIDADPVNAGATPGQRPSRWVRALTFGAIPLAVLAACVGAAYLKFVTGTAHQAVRAADESVQAAKDSAIAILSYTPDTAQADLTAARDRLTGTFRDSYTSLTDDVVIPAAKDRHIAVTATVPAAASVSASTDHAVVLLFVNQAIIMGNDAPTATGSVVEVTLDKHGNRWLVSGFEPR